MSKAFRALTAVKYSKTLSSRWLFYCYTLVASTPISHCDVSKNVL